jgi:predicted nucleic-acid-binding protein
MIGLDTNILVRYLTQDDPIQSPKAREIIERRLTEENPAALLLHYTLQMRVSDCN